MPAPIGIAEQYARIAYAEQSLRGPASVEQGKGQVGPTAVQPAGEFAERLRDLVEATDSMQRDATAKTEAVAEGKSNDLHGTMIAVRQADIQLRLMATVRNKVIEAYREVMRMGA